ncbi:hypothetical protein NIES4071_108070 (plasmid) [Calothrix sp. NIES-4071]|nr:hypothetical protein NIES4071_108070 [Calothrix sp. NIES-4071]BAZ64847.1 hypothetical protein NIES4105_105800 [Calothrix sp. NIES-4105]
MIYTGASLTEVFAETGLSYQLADARLKAIIKEWLQLRTVSYPEVSENDESLDVGELKHQFQTDTGLYCFNGTMLGCILEIGQKVRKIKGFIPYLDTNLKLNNDEEDSDDYEEIEKVDSDKFYSALKYYTTNFECNTFKKYFGDGADTESEIVDSWYRLENLGVKIKEGATSVRFDIPNKYLVGVSVPTFIKPWIPKASHTAKV